MIATILNFSSGTRPQNETCATGTGEAEMRCPRSRFRDTGNALRALIPGRRNVADTRERNQFSIAKPDAPDTRFQWSQARSIQTPISRYARNGVFPTGHSAGPAAQCELARPK